MHTTGNKFGTGDLKKSVFWCFLCSPRLHSFYAKFSKNSNVVKYYYDLKSFLLQYIVLFILVIPVVYPDILICCSRNIYYYYYYYSSWR